jgi:hypothetical protein
MSTLRKPSEITEPGWYFAEERIDDDGDGSDYQLTVLHADTDAWGVMRFDPACFCDPEDLFHKITGAIYDAAAADAWFRIICRIDEPEITGGWG